MRTLIILCLFICGCAQPSELQKLTATTTTIPNVTQLVDSATITAIGNDNRSDFPISNTLDGSNSSFMTTNTLSMSELVYISYQFQNPIRLAKIDLFDQYTNNYNMGDLDILVSADSTNGVNGTWESIGSLSSISPFINGSTSVTTDKLNVKWVKLQMTYTGTGAYGGTPSFYLSEIKFYEEI